LTPLANLGTFTFDGVNPHFNISFNLCNDITDASKRCKEDEPAMAVARSLNNFEHVTECYKIAGSGEGLVDHYILDKEENNGIKIHLGGSHTPCDDWRDFDLTVDIICNINAKEGIMNVNITESNHCFKVVSFEHVSGCKIGQLSALWEWAHKYGFVIAIPFMIIGIIMLFYGSRWMKTVFYVTGIILAVSCIWLIFYTTFM